MVDKAGFKYRIPHRFSLTLKGRIFNKSVRQFVWALAEAVQKYKVSGDEAEESVLKRALKEFRGLTPER